MRGILCVYGDNWFNTTVTDVANTQTSYNWVFVLRIKLF